MEIKLSNEDLIEAISSYAQKMIISKSSIEITLPDEVPPTITLDHTIFDTDDITKTSEIDGMKHQPAKKAKKPKKPSKAQQAVTDAAIAKLGIEPEVPNADDVEVPEVSEETADIVSQMEGKTEDPAKEAPTKKRMFGQ